MATSPDPSPLTPDQQNLWQQTLTSLNRNNVLCHCRRCGEEWVSSAPAATPYTCGCGSRDVQWIFCWQFPDD